MTRPPGCSFIDQNRDELRHVFFVQSALLGVAATWEVCEASRPAGWGDLGRTGGGWVSAVLAGGVRGMGDVSGVRLFGALAWLPLFFLTPESIPLGLPTLSVTEPTQACTQRR